MSLLDIAQADTRSILNDSEMGVGVDIRLTTPGGISRTFTGWSNDIALLVDPDTGQAVSGRMATIALSLLDLAECNIPIPEAIPDRNSKPWLVSYDDRLGNSYEFKVVETHPDRTLAVVTCTLEMYI